jgi:hypothetical protein
MRKFICCLLTLVCFTASAQNAFDYSTESTWASTPRIHKVLNIFDSASAVFILDNRKVEYREENGTLAMYTHYHKIVHVRDDRGIEMFNKMYIPADDNTEVVSIRARTILANGRVIDIDSSKINSTELEGRAYRIFAVEGLEKNSEIEFEYVIRKSFQLFGSEIIQGSSIPCQEARFLLISPSHLRFSVKGHNGVQVSKDSLIGNRLIIAAMAYNFSELESEKYAYSDKYLKRVDYKFSYNLDKSPNTRMYTWKDFAKSAYERYKTLSDNETKALAAFVAKMNTSGEAPVALIQKVEEFIKTNIDVDKKLIAADAENIDNAIKNQATNETGIIKLFTAVFDKLAIQHQIVFPSDRSGYPIDEEVEDWNKINEVILYFPSTGKYLAPAYSAFRYPYIPPNLADTRGLFLKGTTIGSFTTAIGVFSDIRMEPFEDHAHNLEAEVFFNKTADSLHIKAKQIFNGYNGALYRPIFVMMPENRKDEITRELIKQVTGSTNISGINVLNSRLADAVDSRKPLIISAETNGDEMLEKAGNRVLLKIGEILGPQEEMYQQKPRQLPIELDFYHVLDRKILLHIPAGYVVRNLKDIDRDISYLDNGEMTMGFVSSHTQKNNQVAISIHEIYRRNRYPLEQYEQFRKVINAAADFNKLVLVLEKVE